MKQFNEIEDVKSIKLRSDKNWMGLNEHLFELAELEFDYTKRLIYLCKMAEIYEHKLNDQECAFIVYQAALKDDYTNIKIAQEVNRLASSLKSFKSLIKEYSEIPSLIEKFDIQQSDALKELIKKWKLELAKIDQK